MTYKIVIENKALAELASLPKKIQRQIANKIDLLSTNARPSGCKVLKGGKSPLYRIRSGDYRIVYQIRENKFLYWSLELPIGKMFTRGCEEAAK